MNLIPVVGSFQHKERQSAWQPILINLDHLVMAHERTGKPEHTQVLMADGSTLVLLMEFAEFRKNMGFER